MNKQEFKENMLLLRKQVEMLTQDLGMRAEFSHVHIDDLPRHIDYAYDIRLNYKGYNTTDMFSDTMSFGTDDINKVAVALISSFFADYVQALSIMVNK
tara:strand:+ start:946 stop:1239 length:294 start_codon:yes stop_codon:yes gene_type:complete